MNPALLPSANKRNPLAIDTEPTDEELAQVMQEACALAIERKHQSDNWMKQQLALAMTEAMARDNHSK